MKLQVRMDNKDLVLFTTKNHNKLNIPNNNEEYELYREFKKKSPIIYDKQKNDITKQYQIDKNKENMFFVEQTGVTEENFFASCVAERENVKLSTIYN